MNINFWCRIRRSGLFRCIVVVLFCSCSAHREPEVNDIKKPFDAIGIAPRADTLKPPRVTLLDTCKPPRVIAIPAKPSTLIVESGKGKDTLHLTPPVSKPADFYVPMATYTAEQGLYSSIYCIKRDKIGNLWFGTGGGGVIRYDGKSFATYTTAQGLANNFVQSIAEDKTGNLWFGTNGGGVSCYDGKSFTTYTTAQGLANNVVHSITEDKTGNLWFGANGAGVSRYDPSATSGTGSNAFTTYTTAQGLANNSVMSIAEDKTGNLWFGTNGGGVSRYDGKSFTTYTTAQGLASNQVFSIAEDKTGNLWFAKGGGGVSRYDPSAAVGPGSDPFTTYTTAQGLASDQVFSIAEDKTGNLWFATNGGGVSRYDGKSFTTYTTAQGLANNVVVSIAEDKTGNLWFGTNEGFSVLKCFALTGMVKPDEKNDNPNTVAPDNSLSNIKIIENYKPVFEKYNFRNGYPVKDVNENAMHIDSKGIIWAGTGDKLVRFDYSGILKSTVPPHVFINAVEIGGERICWYDLMSRKSKVKSRKSAIEDSMAITNEEVGTFGDVLSRVVRGSIQYEFGDLRFDSIARFYPIPVHLVLPYPHNNITIDFGAIEVARPYLVNYQYMLEGYDKDWDPVTNRSTAAFGNIHEGSYTFKLKAESPDGVWSEPITYTFRVLPPWYRTWWAYIIYLLAGGYTIYAIIRWRTGVERKEKEHLEKVVTERTAQVVNEKKKSDELLLNILPEEVAEELKNSGSAEARQFDDVTVLFTDFVNFTGMAEALGPKVLVRELHECFSTFDAIIEKNGLEKIKTIGDAYLAVCGLPAPDPLHAQKCVQAAKDIIAFMEERAKKERAFNIRIGINSGTVVAGIVGVKKFAYDIWGDTVNTAARMEQNSEAGKINISEATYNLAKDKFHCEYRGEIDAKNKGMMKMYFVS